MYQGMPSGVPNSSLKTSGFSRSLDTVQKISDNLYSRTAPKAALVAAFCGTT